MDISKILFANFVTIVCYDIIVSHVIPNFRGTWKSENELIRRLKYFFYRTKSLPNIDKEERNALFLCSQKDKNYQFTGIMNRSIYKVYTVDYRPFAEADICRDITEKDCFKELPDKSFDYIVLFLCECCCYKIISSPRSMKNIYEQCFRLLKDTGIMYVKYYNVLSPLDEELMGKIGFQIGKDIEDYRLKYATIQKSKVMNLET